MTFLLVDDYAGARLLMREVLDDPDHTFIEAADATEALRHYRDHRPDWVVMDIEKPGMDGLTASRFIRSTNPGARIVIVTSHTGPAMQRAADRAGVAAFLPKEHLLQLPNLLASLSRPTQTTCQY